jgi:hypothetical protein
LGYRRTIPDHHPSALSRHLAGELGHKTSLTDTRLTAHEHPARLPAAD